ncbi:ribonuclease P protein component [SAR86 cluster bacterium]|nr:ribonuclease P protein component [SAR86 cluster bacterium]
MKGVNPERFIIIRRKDFPLAVVRNKIKRRVKTILRTQPVSEKDDLYIKVLKGADEMTYSELNTNILRVLKVQK